MTPDSLPYLPVEDVRKLHAEINQLNNQRFLICIAGISFFGAFGWTLFPKSLEVTPNQLYLTILNAMFLQVILAILCAKSQILRMKAKFLAAYLAVTGSSTWEIDLEVAKSDTRTSKYASMESRALTATFITLGAIPFAIGCWMSTRLGDNSGVWFMLIGAVTFMLLTTWVLTVNHSEWCNKSVEQFEQKWESTLKKSPRFHDFLERKNRNVISLKSRGGLPSNSEIHAQESRKQNGSGEGI